jgi:hypothetical protein
MGHQRLRTLPRTRSWQEVVALIQLGAGARQVANAAIRAAQAGLLKVGKDKGAVETVWLLTQLPFAARADDFEVALRERGLRVPRNPLLLDLTAAFTRAVDAQLANNRGRTDLGEMAQMAAAETLAGLLGERTDSLYGGASPAEVQAELGKLCTVKQFGLFARRFFARFIYKVLDYYLSRVLPENVGGGRRFVTLDDLRRFTAALETHCWETALVVQEFTGVWASKTRWQRGGIDRDDACRLAHGAVSKLVSALRLGAGLPADPHDEEAIA